MTTTEDIDRWFSENSFSENTTEKYSRAINQIAAEHNLETLTTQEFKTFLTRPQWGDSQRWLYYCAIKSFLRWRYGANHPALLLKIKRLDTEPQRSLTLEQVITLLASFDTTTEKGIRDLAICSLALDTGLRCSELCNLELSHLHTAICTLFARIKGARWEQACYSEHTARYLENWLSVRKTAANDKLKTVFCALGGNTPGQQLTRCGLSLIVKNWGKKSGLAPLSPHDLRRTFAILSTEAGAPSRLLQIAGRWKDLKMVERYTRNLQLKGFSPYLPLNTIFQQQQPTAAAT